ncbi:hypothetical protein EKO23_04100 [Nocardioides guangzhouensis]|uniref:Uncharacterized protein n=1 Tax=Nocardioides guangzhouensis TaxID=2497878 RepID=A0A4Q4ZJB1_9ACTN|nr:hypothetical protein [Nocardioides guangzhouensis]RYP88038.1 hypothetical protein EKO23_04100 [Nocardioides guangzhouensis]
MLPRVAVGLSTGPGWVDSLASLDRQSLPPRDVEVLLLDSGDDPDLTRRLVDAVHHRTNVRLTQAGPAGDTPSAQHLAKLTSADYVLELPAGSRVTRSGLDCLVRAADRSNADACTGQVGRPSRGLALVPDGAPATWGRLLRRSTLEGGDPVEVEETVPDVVLFDGPNGSSAVPGDEPDVDTAPRATDVRWTGGVLHLALELPPSTGADARVTVSLFSPVVGIDWPVDERAVEAGPTSGTDVRSLLVAVDPATLAAGQPLPTGTWWPVVRVHHEGRPASVSLVRVGRRRAAGGTHHGIPVVTFAERGRLGLDVGASDHPLVPRIRAGQCRVEESARGSLMTCHVPELDLEPGARLRGHVRLGRFEALADLEGAAGGGADLTAWVSGLPGSSRLFTKFSSSGYSPTGARLVIDGTGGMRVRPVRRKGGGGEQAAPAAPAAPGRTDPVRWSRQRLAPVLRRLKKVTRR